MSSELPFSETESQPPTKRGSARLTDAVAQAYASVLSRRTKRTWIIAPGPARNGTMGVREITGSLELEEHENAVRDDASRPAAGSPPDQHGVNAGPEDFPPLLKS